MTNCRNCGALLQDWKCLYCGTQYPELKDVFESKPITLYAWGEPIMTSSLDDPFHYYKLAKSEEE